jgi:serine/threonine protein kinase
MANRVYTRAGQLIELEVKPVAPPGGEGAVYRVISGYARPDCCAKIYHAEKRTDARFRKVDFMIRNQPASLQTSNYIICWPLELVFDGQRRFAGFIMPLAFAESEKLYELTTLRTKPTLLPKWQKFDRLSLNGEKYRLMMCVNIAIAVHAIHAVRKYTIVDYKPQNLLISIAGKVSLTDIDSIQIANAGVVLYPAEVTTPEYAPPECQFIVPGTCYVPDSWDRFSMAVSFYELLFGIHPFTATAGGRYAQSNQINEKILAGLFVHGAKKNELVMVPGPHAGFPALPKNIQNLFVQALESGAQNPQARPSAELWGQTISRELEHYRPRKIAIPVPVRKPSPPPVIPTGQFMATPTGGGLSQTAMIWIGIVAFFGFVVMCNRLNSPGPSQPAAQAAATDSPKQTQNIVTARPHLKLKLKTVDSVADPVNPCESETGEILLTNSTDHVLTIHLSIYSAKTGRWGAWLEFPDVPAQVSNIPITQPDGKSWFANRYRYYVEYTDSPGNGKYSKDQPREVSKCEASFVATI